MNLKQDTWQYKHAMNFRFRTLMNKQLVAKGKPLINVGDIVTLKKDGKNE